MTSAIARAALAVALGLGGSLAALAVATPASAIAGCTYTHNGISTMATVAIGNTTCTSGGIRPKIGYYKTDNTTTVTWQYGAWVSKKNESSSTSRPAGSFFYKNGTFELK
ncbi:MAG: hypothetical protein FWD59_05060 [Micrococcales bacterium]|nr:hypothetical protein [Micrococcales bacterium]